MKEAIKEASTENKGNVSLFFDLKQKKII